MEIDPGLPPRYDEYHSEPFHLARTAQGQRHPLLILSPDQKANEEVWQALSGIGHFWRQSVVGLKREAVPLLAVQGPGAVPAAQDCVLAFARHGKGGSLYLGFRADARWAGFDPFCRQMVRTVAEGRLAPHLGRLEEAGAASAGENAASGGPEGRTVVGSIVFPSAKPEGMALRADLARHLITPDVEKAIQRLLRRVKDGQQADGSWGDKSFPKSCGVTALCCMALLAEGSLPREGLSGKRLDQGISFLLSCAKEDGLVVARDTHRYGPLRDHLLATNVLLQAYGDSPWQLELRAKLSRALQRLLTAHKPDRGWGYTLYPIGSGDLTITADALWTLQLAKRAGLAVPEARVRAALGFVDLCGKSNRPGEEGAFGLRESGERGGLLPSAAGLAGYFSAGLYAQDQVKPGLERMSEAFRRATVEDLLRSGQLPFECYYAGQVFFQAGEGYFLPWYRKFVSLLDQIGAGGGSFQDGEGNTMYPAAIAAIILQLPLRQLWGCPP